MRQNAGIEEWPNRIQGCVSQWILLLLSTEEREEVGKLQAKSTSQWEHSERSEKKDVLNLLSEIGVGDDVHAFYDDALSQSQMNEVDCDSHEE